VRRQTDRDEPAYKRPMAKLVVVALTLALAALLGAARGSAGPVQEVKLIGSVGPEFTISLTDAQGNPVTKLDPGAHEIEVTDRSDFHRRDAPDHEPASSGRRRWRRQRGHGQDEAPPHLGARVRDHAEDCGRQERQVDADRDVHGRRP
jgi:hypothetical protein